jgi:hypothetical protein
MCCGSHLSRHPFTMFMVLAIALAGGSIASEIKENRPRRVLLLQFVSELVNLGLSGWFAPLKAVQ